jgi:hypothetical protein
MQATIEIQAVTAEAVTIPERTGRFSRRDMINAIQEARVHLHKTPTKVAYNAYRDGDPTLPSKGTIERYFGSWNNAMKAAGITPNRATDRWREINFRM